MSYQGSDHTSKASNILLPRLPVLCKAAKWDYLAHYLFRVLRIDVSPLGKQQGDHLPVSPFARPKQGRLPSPVSCLRHHAIMPSCHNVFHVIMSSCYHVRHVIMSCHYAIMSSCHHVIMSLRHHAIIQTCPDKAGQSDSYMQAPSSRARTRSRLVLFVLSATVAQRLRSGEEALWYRTLFGRSQQETQRTEKPGI